MGLAATASKSGDGGTGTVSSIDGTRRFFAGGGGGGADNYRLVGSRGYGVAGGGNGGDYQILATDATANSGSGGGGGADTSSGAAANNGGSGGSGIVIIRYPANCAPPASTTGLQQVLYNNGYQIYVWTSSGTITF